MSEHYEKQYEEILVRFDIPNSYLEKLDTLIKKKIFTSRAEAFRRSLELLFEKYQI